MAGGGTPADCTSGFALAPGASCNLSLSFTPQSVGALTGSAVLTDNALNAPAASQSMVLTGTGSGTAPVITSAASATFYVGTPGSFPVTGTGTPAPAFSAAGTLPADVTFNATTGLLSGTPAAGDVGVYTVTITASNGVTPAAAQSFTLTIVAASQAPVISSAASTTFYVGAAGSFPVTASGTPAPAFSETGALPAGVSFSAAGVLSGTPAANASGSYPISITASNGVLPNAVQSFTLTVAPAVSYTLAAAFGSVNVCGGGTGTPGPCSQSVTLNYSVGTATTFGGISVLTQGAANQDFQLGSGSTCVGQVGAGSSCGVNVTFAPLWPGWRQGAVTLTDGSGNVLASTLVQGLGEGPAVAFGPGVQTAVAASGLSSPAGMALDGAGDVFIADAGNSRVVEVTAGGVQTAVAASGLSSPAGVAVDGAGDVYIADTGNSRVVEVTAGGVQTAVAASGLSSPAGVAVDGAGDVYIADTGNSRVVEVTPGGVQTVVAASGLSSPAGVAVDGAGDVYIADTGNSRVVEVTAGGVQTTLGSGLSGPAGVALDGAGDVYIADTGNSRVVEVTAGGAQTVVAASGLSGPAGVALDGAGDVWIADAGNSRVVEEQRGPAPALGFAATAVGSTSSDSPQAVTVQNIGNQVLSAVAPGLSVGGNFAQVAGGGTPADCTSGFALAPGASCNLSLSFTPQSVGALTGSAVLTDNALNAPAASQSMVLTGTGSGTAPVITSAASATFYVGTPGSFPVTGTGTPAPAFSAAGTLPADVTFNATTGLLSGTPAAGDVGVYTVTITASNGVTPAAAQSFTLTIVAASQAPVISSAASTTFYVGAAGSFPVTASGTPAPAFSETGALPAGVSFSAAGVLSGTPAANASGSYPISITASNGVLPNAVQSFTLTVAPAVSYTLAAAFGSVNVCGGGTGTPGPCSQSVTLNYSVGTATTFGGISVLTQGAANQDFQLGSGSTCVGQVGAGSSCGVNVTFAPLWPGWRQGAVTLTDGSGNVLASTLVQGLGEGPAVAFGPGVQTAVAASGLSSPAGMALDGAGDVFIADAGNSRVVEVTAGGVQTAVAASGLSSPAGVAVDGAGDVYIADTGNSRVVEVTAGGVQTAVAASGLSSPAGVAVDGAGDVYIADTGNSRVVEVTPGGVQTVVAASGLSSPAGVAVDGAGDVYIADTGNSRVVEVTAGGVQTTLGSGLSGPAGVALDGAGDVYIADTGNSRVVEVTAGGAQTVVAASGLSGPAGVALDGAGDVWIADAGNSRVVEEQRGPAPALGFAATAVGSTSSDSPQAVTVQNIGNQVLSAVAPGLSVGGNFAQVAGGGTPADCTSGFALAPGASCNLSLSFTPQSVGALTGSAVLTDNALNAPAASQSMVLTGTGKAATTTTTLSATPNSAALGEPVILTATLIGNPNPTGTVTFTNGSTVIGSITLSGSAVATLSTAALPLGTNNLKASYTGNGVYSPSTSNTVAETIMPSAGPPTVVSVSPTSGSGLQQTFTAVYSDPNGVGDLSSVRVLINSSITGVNACYVFYYPLVNALYMENDADNGTVGPLTPGSASSISNSQCTLSGAGTSVSSSGNTLTVKFALTFASTFSALKNIYLSSNSLTATSGWVPMGSWSPISGGPPHRGFPFAIIRNGSNTDIHGRLRRSEWYPRPVECSNPVQYGR